MSGAIIAGGPRVPAELVTDAGVNVELDGDLVVGKAGTVNFEGAGVSVENVSGVATVTISGGAGGTVETDATLKGDGSGGDLLGINPGHVAVVADGTTIAGTGVTGTPLHTVAGGTAVAVDGTSVTGTGLTGSPLHAHIIVDDEGTPVVSAATALNFAGAGVTATSAGGGVALITIPGGGGGGGTITVVNGDTSDTFPNIDTVIFTGMLVSSPSAGQAEIDAAGNTLEHNGSNVQNNVTGFNFIGTGVAVTTGAGNTVDVTINTPADPNVVTVTFESDVNPGNAVYILASDGHAELTSAEGTDLQALCLGLCTASHSATTSGLVRVGGPMTLTTSDWDNVTGDTGGLAPGHLYYLADGDTLGNITATPPVPSGEWRSPIGYAVSATTMIIRVQLSTVIP